MATSLLGLSKHSLFMRKYCPSAIILRDAISEKHSNLHQVGMSFQCKRNFNATSKTLARRRKRQGSYVVDNFVIKQRAGKNNNDSDHIGSESDRSPIKPVALCNLEVFLAEANFFLDRVEMAVEPMKLCNNVFEVVRSYKNENKDIDESVDELRINLQPHLGIYSLLVDEEGMCLLMTSPISGLHSYVLSVVSGEWIGTEDGHSLEGLLVRDLIRQCNGVPSF